MGDPIWRKNLHDAILLYPLVIAHGNVKDVFPVHVQSIATLPEHLRAVHESRVPRVIVVIRTCRIRRLTPFDLGEPGGHLSIPARDVDENLPHAPRAKPHRPNLRLVEAVDGFSQLSVRLFGCLKPLLLVSHVILPR